METESWAETNQDRLLSKYKKLHFFHQKPKKPSQFFSEEGSGSGTPFIKGPYEDEADDFVPDNDDRLTINRPIST